MKRNITCKCCGRSWLAEGRPYISDVLRFEQTEQGRWWFATVCPRCGPEDINRALAPQKIVRAQKAKLEQARLPYSDK